MNTIDVFEDLTAQELVVVEGGGWKCAAGVGGGMFTGLAGAGIGLAAASNPIGWVAGGIIIGSAVAGGGLTGAATFC